MYKYINKTSTEYLKWHFLFGSIVFRVYLTKLKQFLSPTQSSHRKILPKIRIA